MIEITLSERVAAIGDQRRGDRHFVQRPPACLGAFGMPVFDQEQDLLGNAAGADVQAGERLVSGYRVF